jgi:acetyl esterase/lipase
VASLQAHFLSFVLRQTLKRCLGRANARYARALLEALKFPPPADLDISQLELGGVPAERLQRPSGEIHSDMLYLHGGGYVACSARTHRPVTTAFARSGFRVFALNYRLAPENPFPAAVEDAVGAYRALRDAAGPESSIVIAGDSAGGGLAVATMLKLRDDGDALPIAAALFSPFTDLAGGGESRCRNDRRCAMFHGKNFARATHLYMAGADPRNPLASPVYGDLTGLPPMLIHVGRNETLLDDSTRLAALAESAGIPVELKIWPAVPHAWQVFQRFVPEGRESLREAADFLCHAVTASTPRLTEAVRSSLPQPTSRPRSAYNTDLNRT